MIRTAPRVPVAALLLALVSAPAAAAPYTYQGELLDGDLPAEGRFDVRVRSFAAGDATKALGEPTTLPGVVVSKGRLALQLDLPDAHPGELQVEVAIRPAGSDQPFAVLGAPQAVGKAAIGCWALDGNSGLPSSSFLGIAENVATPLVLRARDSAVATFSPDGSASAFGDAPRVALGSSANLASATGASVGGGGATLDGDQPCGDCGNVASAVFASVGGGFGNLASGVDAHVSGGRGNTASGEGGTVSGGQLNQATASGSTVSGGVLNFAAETLATVAGGRQNVASGFYSAVAGGLENVASGNNAVVAGGEENVAQGPVSSVTGGQQNLASGAFSTSLGGLGNCAGGDSSVALGRFAYSRHGNEAGDLACPGVADSGDADGDEESFVWADGGLGPMIERFGTTGPHQFLVRARGGVGINAAPPNASVELTVTSDSDGSDAASLWLKQRAAANAGMLISGVGSELRIEHYNGVNQFPRMELASDGSTEIRSSATGGATGVVLPAGGGAWGMLSDRHLKTAIEAVDPGQVLDRLLALPIARWSYIAQGEGIRHLGPMAQDFAAAFGLGESERHIGGGDADGVALAAIQGLNRKLEHENAALRGELGQLRARLDRLEARLAR
jgi:hypothetical protein